VCAALSPCPFLFCAVWGAWEGKVESASAAARPSLVGEEGGGTTSSRPRHLFQRSSVTVLPEAFLPIEKGGGIFSTSACLKMLE